MIEEIVSVGALVATLSSFAGTLLAKRFSAKVDEKDEQLQSLRHHVQQLSALSFETTQDLQLTAEEIARLQSTLDALQEDLQHAISKNASHLAGTTNKTGA